MRLIMLVCFFGYLGAIEVHENVIFEKVNEITTTKSQWKLALIMDVSLFKNALEKMINTIDSAERIASISYPTENDPTHRPFGQELETSLFTDSLRNLKGEIQFLRATHQQLLESYIDFEPLHNRNKRTLLPLSGFFKFVFGTAEDSEVSALKHSVKRLEKTQRSILHVLESNLSILNVTRNDISQNRQAINSIISALGDLDQKMNRMTGKLEKQIAQLQQYTLTYHHLQLIIDEIKSLTRHAQFYLQHFERQLNMLSMSRLSPSTITPLNLKALLKEIMTQVPPSYILPADIDTNLWDFYRILSCDTFLYENQIAILIHIPLLDLDGNLNVYRIHNLEIPYFQQNASLLTDNQNVAMTAKYDLDTPAIMINTERTKFAILNLNELEKCSNPVQKFCEVSSPMYQISLSQRCSIALFTKNEAKINSFCNTIVSPNTKLPIAEYLYQGHWVVTTNVPLRFVVICYTIDKKQSELVVRPPMDFIKLQMNCRAYNEHLTLNAWFSKSSKQSINDTHDLSFFPNITKINIWKPIQNTFGNSINISMPKQLNNLQEIPMSQLIDQLQHLRELPVDDTTNVWPVWRYVLIALAVLSILAVVIFYVKIRKCTSKYRTVKSNEQKHNTSALTGYPAVRMNTLREEDTMFPLVASAPPNHKPESFSSSIKTDVTPNHVYTPTNHPVIATPANYIGTRMYPPLGTASID